MRFFAAMGKLMLGMSLHAAPVVVKTRCARVAVDAAELRAVDEPDERVGADPVGRRRDRRVVHVPTARELTGAHQASLATGDFPAG